MNTSHDDARRSVCREFEDRIVDWVAGSLAPRNAVAVSRHVEACDRCRAEAESVAALLRDVERAAPAVAERSESDWERATDAVRSALDTSARRRARTEVWAGFVGLSAALVLVIAVWQGAARSDRDGVPDMATVHAGPQQAPAPVAPTQLAPAQPPGNVAAGPTPRATPDPKLRLVPDTLQEELEEGALDDIVGGDSDPEASLEGLDSQELEHVREALAVL